MKQTTKEIMSTIYKENLWGGRGQAFYSGQGSHKDKIMGPYIKAIKEWLAAFEEKLHVCDLGCGDFNVGNQLVPFTKKYIGIDIVDELIDRNKRLYKQDNLEFRCLDIISDELPTADCIFVRQVLQHLSNEKIHRVLKRIKRYRYMIITEHLPFEKFNANADKYTGSDNRLGLHSGVVLTEAPYHLNPLKETELLSIHIRRSSKIVTTLYQNF